MAPKPHEHVDFQDLSDKILELLRILWAFVRDLCIALWSHISHAFWAVWTYPPFETFRNELAAAFIALWDYVVAHPITATAICILAFIVIPAVFDTVNVYLLRCLGFRKRDVLRGSYATYYQSTDCDGNVPANSTFAHCQSPGAKVGGGYRAVGGAGSSSWA